MIGTTNLLIKKPLFENLSPDPEGFEVIKDARPLLILAIVLQLIIFLQLAIQKESPTGDYFMSHQILQKIIILWF